MSLGLYQLMLMQCMVSIIHITVSICSFYTIRIHCIMYIRVYYSRQIERAGSETCEWHLFLYGDVEPHTFIHSFLHDWLIDCWIVMQFYYCWIFIAIIIISCWIFIVEYSSSSSQSVLHVEYSLLIIHHRHLSPWHMFNRLYLSSLWLTYIECKHEWF